jgi:NADP-dependent 3-hydroxy acid dehydrogenase YdfG
MRSPVMPSASGEAKKTIGSAITSGCISRNLASISLRRSSGIVPVAVAPPGSNMLTEIPDSFRSSAMIADSDSVAAREDAVKWVKTEWGKIDVLVNNAGIGMRTVNPRFLAEKSPFTR